MALRRAALLAAATVTVLIVGACSDSVPTPKSGPTPTSEPTSKSALVRVPTDVATLQEAADRVAAGGVIQVERGTYEQSVTISTPDVTIRGTDRNATIIDGSGSRPYGVVGIADGIRVQNLTVRNHTFYGVLITGLHDAGGPRANNGDAYEPFDPATFPPVQRFSISYVTAHNNGLYGVYAFDAQHGVIADSYASGSADSGFYVGQCRQCDILVRGNVAERNAVGFENANASEPLTIVGNRFSGNRVGLTLLSNYQEAFRPEKGNVVVGNVISDNTAADSPAQADGGFGTGIGIAGGVDNRIVRNRIEHNRRAGVLLANTEDLPATGNRFEANAFAGNGVDLANISADRAPATDTCLRPPARTLPRDLAAQLSQGCAAGSGTIRLMTIDADRLPSVSVPDGVSFLKVAPPQEQPIMPAQAATTTRLPDSVTMPTLDDIGVPPADLLVRVRGAR